MHVLSIHEDYIQVGFKRGSFYPMFTFPHEKLNVAMALVNYLNGGRGYVFNYEIAEENITTSFVVNKRNDATE